MAHLSRRGILASGTALAGLGALGAPAFAQGPAAPAEPPHVERFDPSLDALIDVNAPVEHIVTSGFEWCEGPVWVGGADGYLLCSDPRANAILQWTPARGLQTWMKPSGFQGPPDPVMFREAGTNGLILARGTLMAADSGTRAIVAIDIATKKRTVLADRFEGKRLNSPNDLAVSPSNGMIYFTDPPYGLNGIQQSKAREMDYTGVFKLAPDNTVSLIGKYQMPNGVAVSPDGRTLYHTDGARGWVAHTLDAQGNSTGERDFIDRVAQHFTNPRASGDGMKVDAAGNLWVSGDGGITVINAQGHRIGRIRISGSAPNCEFGADGYLYIPGGTGIYRVKAKATKLKA